jgi:4-amino-4-deoxy-L-arabinose transferase-like glycosyltransferase
MAKSVAAGSQVDGFEGPERLHRNLFASRLGQFQDLYHSRPALFLWVLTVLFAAWAYLESKQKPLWFDELLGLYASTQPHLRDVLSALAGGVDVNPPIYHYITRLSVELFGISAMAARIPAFLAMLVFLACIYVFLSRRLKPGFGGLAVALIICMPLRSYAWEARPYTLVLGLTGVAMVAWQHYRLRMAQRSRWIALPIFALACGLLTGTHYYAALIPLIFAGTEIVVGYKQRRLEWPLLFASLIPLGAALFLLRGTILSQKGVIAHYHSGGTYTSFVVGYDIFAIPAWCIAMFVLVLAFEFWIERRDYRAVAEEPNRGLTEPEVLLAVMLSLLPVFGAVATLVLHAYIPRYFLAASAGLTVLVCDILYRSRHVCSNASLLLSACAAFFIFYNVHTVAKHPSELPAVASLGALDGITEPVVFEDAKDYLQAVYLNPQISKKIFYVAEPSLAYRVIGSDSDDRIMQAVAAREAVQVVTLDALAGSGRDVVIVPGRFGWLEACVMDMGIDMSVSNLALDHSRTLPITRTKLPSAGARWCESASK